MSAYNIPRDISHKMGVHYRAFWWGHEATEKKMHFLAWDNFIRPKREGLGFRNPAQVNESSVGKLFWRFLANLHQLWARFLRGVYLQNRNIWREPKRARASPTWSSMLNIRLFMEGNVCWKIRGGWVDIIADPWVLGIPRYRVSACHTIPNGPKLVRDLMDHVGRRWDLPLINALFSPYGSKGTH